MAAPLVVVEGFDSGDHTACFTTWGFANGITFTPGRVSGQCVRFYNPQHNDMCQRAFTSSNNEITMGIAVQTAALSSTQYPILSIIDTAGSVLLQVHAGTTAWSLGYYGGGTTMLYLPFTPVPNTNGIWGYLEIKFVYATAGYMEARWNGGTVCSRSGVNTRTNAVTGVIGGISFAPSTSINDLYFDDMWIESGANSAFRGDRRVVSLSPTSDVAKGWASSTGANHWGEVDDTVFSTYVSTPVGSGAVDTYGFSDLPSGTFLVEAVAVKAIAFGDYGPANLALHRGGTAGTTLQVPTGQTMVSQVFETDAGGAPWNVTSVNASNFGIVAAP